MPGGDFWQIQTFEYPQSLFLISSADNVTADDTNENITESDLQNGLMPGIRIEEMKIQEMDIQWKTPNLRVDSYYNFEQGPIAEMENGVPCNHNNFGDTKELYGIYPGLPDADEDTRAQKMYKEMLASSQMNKNTQYEVSQYYYYNGDGGFAAWQLPVMFCIGAFAFLAIIVIARRRRRMRALSRRRRSRNAKASTVIAIHSPLAQNGKGFARQEVHTSDDDCDDYTMVMGIPMEEEKKEQVF